MKAIKKSLCFALAVLSAVFTARAVDPVAVWSGDFDMTTKGKYTINANGNTVAADGSCITIVGNNGMLVDWSDRSDFSTDGYITVIVKYSNWSAGANNGALATLWAGGDGSNNKDIVGPFTTASSGVLGNIWNGAIDERGTKQNKTLSASGVFSFDYSGDTAPKGSVAYVRDGSGNFVEACSGNGTLFTSSKVFYGLAIGGSRNAQNNLKSQANMKIEAIAIFNVRLTAAQLADYEFPAPGVETFEFSNINCGVSSNGGQGDYAPTSFKIPVSDELPEGTELKIKSITFAQQTGTDYHWDKSAEFIKLNNIQSDSRNGNSQTLQAWSLGNKLEYPFSEDVVVKVGTTYPMSTVQGNGSYAKMRIRLFNTTADEYGYILLDNSMDAWRPAYKIVAETLPAQRSPKVVALINIDNVNDGGTKINTPADGWYNTGWGDTGPANITTTATNGVVFATLDNASAGKLWAQVRPSGDFRDSGNYVDIKGQAHTTIVDEMKASLNAGDDFVFDEKVYKSGLQNGQAQWRNAKISGLDKDSPYLIYVGIGIGDRTTEFKIEDAGVGSIGELAYVSTADNSANTQYKDLAVGTGVSNGANGILVVRMNEVTPLNDGTVNFRLSNYAGINFIAISKLPAKRQNAPEAEVADVLTWDDLVWDSEPKSGKPVKLNVTKDAMLTIDQNLDYSRIEVVGTGDLTIDNSDGFTVPAIDAKNLAGTVTIKTSIAIAVNAGSNEVVYEHAGTAELSPMITTSGRLTLNGAGTVVFTAKPASEIFISQGATVKINHGSADALNGVKIFGSGLLVFNGNGNGGDLLNIVKCSFDASWTGTVEFNHYTGGSDRTAFLLGNANSFVRYVNCEGWFRSNSDPQVSGATGYEMNVELVDNGGTGIKINNGWSGWNQTRWIAFNKLTGTGTLAYNWAQANPGNPIIVRDLSEFEGAFSLTIPADKCGAVIVSPTATYETISQTEGNGKVIVCADGVANVAKGKTWTAVKGIVVNGTIGGEGTLGSATTFGEDATLDLDKGALSVTGTLTLPSRIKLAVTNPEHAMTVLNVPAGFTTTSCKALVGDKVCDLFLEGTALKLNWKVPPTITVDADDVTIKTADDWNGGVVTIGLGGLSVGDYADDITYRLKFGDKTVTGSAANGVATFELGADDFTAGNIYRGTFELEYGTGNAPIVAAEVTVYTGEKIYGTKEGWINETTMSHRSTGVYDPEQGATVDDGFIKFSNPSDVVFTPTNSPADYVAKCDSEVTFKIFSGEEAIQDDDDTVAADLQAGVRIVDNGNGGVKFQFISGDAWIDGPAAVLNTTYEVTVNFHYAKEAGDTDSVTYTVGETVQSCARRANVAEKLETISFADGTQIASLTGTCDIEVANPVEKETGLAPGADGKELKATNEDDAQTEAKKIPVVVPSEVVGGLTEGLSADAAAAAKAAYTTNFTVVAQKNASGKFVAIVMPTEAAEQKAEKEVQKVSADVLTEVTALTGTTEEGMATVENAVPGFFYGVAENGEVVNMKTAEPEEWKMAGVSGKVELKVTKPANAKARFYKIICSPLPKSAK